VSLSEVCTISTVSAAHAGDIDWPVNPKMEDYIKKYKYKNIYIYPYLIINLENYNICIYNINYVFKKVFNFILPLQSIEGLEMFINLKIQFFKIKKIFLITRYLFSK
jgi:hypothetical protein